MLMRFVGISVTIRRDQKEWLESHPSINVSGLLQEALDGAIGSVNICPHCKGTGYGVLRQEGETPEKFDCPHCKGIGRTEVKRKGDRQ